VGQQRFGVVYFVLLQIYCPNCWASMLRHMLSA
jgi:hypothetical protein